MNNKVFYQHPNLMRALGMHETVMEVMVNVLGGGGDSKVTVISSSLSLSRPAIYNTAHIRHYASEKNVCFFLAQEIRFPQMVTSCCRFLCYFCRISRQNQRSMFDHLSYLLQNSGIGLGESPVTLFTVLCVWLIMDRFYFLIFFILNNHETITIKFNSLKHAGKKFLNEF